MKIILNLVISVCMIVLLSFVTVQDTRAATKKAPPVPVSGTDTTATPKVEIYITDWCPYCTKAVKFLKANRISYKAYNVDTDSAAEARRAKLAGRSGVPFAVINGKKILGYSEEMYKEALGLK